MFIRFKPFKEEGKFRVQIVENFRFGTKVKQKILRHVGVCSGDMEKAKMTSYAEELMMQIKEEREQSSGFLFDAGQLPVDIKKQGRPKKKNLSDILPVDEVKLSDLQEVERIIEGVDEVGGYVYRQLKFDGLLSRKKDQNLLQDIVLARMVHPDSKRGTCKLLKDKFAKEYDLSAVYRMMDKLHPHIGRIKELSFLATKSLLPNNEVSLLFFDVTTLYFESIVEDDLRNFGYSKDHRFNTTQLVLALATNEDGLPLGYELFSGNTAEVTTLLKAIESWKNYIKIKDLYFVADRAMFTKDNLVKLDDAGYRYIIAAKLKSLSHKTQNQILSDESYQPTIINNQLAWISDIDYEGKRLITSYKSARARNDYSEREKILQKIEKLIGKKGSTKKLINNSGVKKYTKTDQSFTEIDQEKIQREALWDGLHGIITNDKNIQASTAIAKYSRLWVIEQAFRINKHNLKMRPIYHWTPRRIESHIAICYMAFTAMKHIEYKASLTKKISPKEIMNELLSVQSSILKHKKTGDLYWLPGKFRNEARKIYKTFNIIRNDSPRPYLK